MHSCFGVVTKSIYLCSFLGTTRHPSTNVPLFSSRKGCLFLLLLHFRVCRVASVVSYSLWPHGLQPVRLLCPWDSPGKNTGAGCHALLQGTFLTQGWNPRLLLCSWIFTSQSPGKSLTFVPDFMCILRGSILVLFNVKIRIELILDF